MSKKILSIYHPEGEVFEYEGKQVVAEKDVTCDTDNPCGNCYFSKGEAFGFSRCLATDLNCVKDDVIFKIVK